MPETQYRLFFNNSPATNAQLQNIQKIVVEQEVDMAWEVRMTIPIAVDAQGNWTGEDESFMNPFTRLRVEVKLGNDPYTPLFDGPVTGFDSRMKSEPGQSTITLIAQDDTFYMNRIEGVIAFENLLDHEVVMQIFSEYADFITTTHVESTPATGSALDPYVVQRGTAMDTLRLLAQRQGKHAYILPSDSPAAGIGCFKAFPTTDSGLPALILLGSDRNIDELNVRYCACKPCDVTADTLRISDKQVVSETASSRDTELMGDETGEEESGQNVDAAIQRLLPRQGESVELQQAVSAKAAAASFAYDISGNIIPDTYNKVIQPYNIITLRAGNTPVSGDYVIVKTTHTITRSSYMQSFSLKRNARSARFSAGQSNVPGGIF
jgi:hypothetical protein